MTSYVDAVSARHPRWMQLNTRALTAAHDSVPAGQSWCLFSYWRRQMSPERSCEQHSMIAEGLGPRWTSLEPIRVQALMAHYRVDDTDRTRLEPWIFASGGVRIGLAAWFRSRFRRPIAFWGDQSFVSALTPDGTRVLGPFGPGAIAHATCESSSNAATFVAFDLPAASFGEALARSGANTLPCFLRE